MNLFFLAFIEHMYLVIYTCYHIIKLPIQFRKVYLYSLQKKVRTQNFKN